VFGGAFAIFIFRAGFIYWFAFTFANYILAKLLYRFRVYPILVWIFAISTLYYNKLYQGYGFKWISKDFGFLDESMQQAPSRWFILYNITLLRVISFGMDLYWAKDVTTTEIVKSELTTYRQRTQHYQPIESYDLLSYYSYLLYAPLFIAGPIMSFNAYKS